MITMMALGFLLPAPCCLLPFALFWALSFGSFCFWLWLRRGLFAFWLIIFLFWVLFFSFCFLFFLLLPLRFVLGSRSAFVSSCVHFISFDFLWRWQCAHVCTFDRQSTRRHFICSAARTQPCSPRVARNPPPPPPPQRGTTVSRAPCAEAEQNAVSFPFSVSFPVCLPACQPACLPACLSV